MLVAASWLNGCDQPSGDYLPASSIAQNGFVRGLGSATDTQGREIKLWGYVDHGNLYGDAKAKRILQEWWAGDGPDAATWRFNLKAGAQDAVGHSFAMYIPNDDGCDDLLRRFVQDARAGRPTKVLVTGRLFTFDAPTQALALTGLYLVLPSSQAIRCDAPE